MNTLGKAKSAKRPYKPYIYRGRIHRNYPSCDRGYNRGRDNFRQMSHDRNRRGYPSFRGKSRSYRVTQKTKIIEIDMTTDNKGSEVNPDSIFRRPRVASKSSSRSNDRCLSHRQFGHFLPKTKKNTSANKVKHKEETPRMSTSV